jgi:hypothetical protein
MASAGTLGHQGGESCLLRNAKGTLIGMSDLPPLLLWRYLLLLPPLPSPLTHQQSARALQHLVPPRGLRQAPWHKSVRTLEIIGAPLPNLLESFSPC